MGKRIRRTATMTFTETWTVTWDSDGTLVLYTSTQAPHYVQYMLAHVFRMPLGKIRVAAAILFVLLGMWLAAETAGLLA